MFQNVAYLHFRRKYCDHCKLYLSTRFYLFTYFFVNPLFTLYIFITGIINKSVLTAKITYGG